MRIKKSLGVRKVFWQVTTLVGIVILFGRSFTNGLQALGMKNARKVPSIIQTVEAKEIYPMFSCPCCGQPLNKEEQCCASATQMIEFIDQKISAKASKDEVILATAKKFGVGRLINESERARLKNRLLAEAPEDSPRISAEKTKIDLGKVSLQGGVITTKFIVKNAGKSELVIDKLASSCGCTSGSLIYKNVEGPRFYMAGHGHAVPDPNWKIAIAPGDEAEVKVYYDPSVHPDLTGPVTREISVYSNDPVEFETKLTITLDQER